MANLPPTGPSRISNPSETEEALRELRGLLFGKEQNRLENIQKRLDDPKLQARDVSRVLPMAIRQRSGEDDQLVPALQSTVEEIFNIAVRRRPEAVVQLLYPIIGPLIRKSISNALRNMLQNLQRTLDSSLSPRSLRWRLEAFRTGRPFSEIVLLHTLRFRVEQAFLIHGETGLVLQHVLAEDAPSRDPDLVSAMLTAIQDFVRDSFEVSAGSSLDTLEFGELRVWIEQGPRAVLAAVIRGDAPLELREDLQEALEEIHLQMARELDAFNGDAAPFESIRHLLEDCLQTEIRDEPPSRGSSIILWGSLAAVLLLLGLWLWSGYRTQARFDAYLDQLENEPGIVITRVERQGSRLAVRGLRDGAAIDPASFLSAHSLDAGQVEAHWESFLALEPEILRRRAESELAPPAGVQLRVEGSVVHLSGTAPSSWIAQTRSRQHSIPGVTRVDTNQVRADAPPTAVAEFLDTVRLAFSEGSQLGPGEPELRERIRRALSELDGWAAQRGQTLQVRLIGNTDALGTEQVNLQLGRERAERAREWLQEGGVSWPSLKLLPASARELGITSQDRSVTLQLELPGEQQ